VQGAKRSYSKWIYERQPPPTDLKLAL